MKIIRVFPRRTKATPTDELVRIGEGPGFFDEADEVHISVAFTWDLPFAERLEKQWRQVAPTKIGGPALNERGGDFVPGMYLKKGYVITSRGCPNHCWFCKVSEREGGKIRELPVTDGWNLLDDNLLACSVEHQESVFAMLTRNRKHGVEFTGGLEAAKLQQWHVDRLREMKPKQMFFAYDTHDDLEPLRQAGRMLLDSGFTVASHALRAYVLCGYQKDTIEKAEQRMMQTIEAGFMPMAMLYRDEEWSGDNQEWKRWRHQWTRPAIINSKMKEKVNV